MFEDYNPIQRPLWVEDGLLEEGLAEYDDTDTIRLTDEGLAFLEVIEAERAKTAQIGAVVVAGEAAVAT